MACEAVNNLGQVLDTKYPERSEVIAGLLTAFVAGEHVLLLGRAGTAKSELTEAVSDAFGLTVFKTLCHRHQSLDEIMGPWDLDEIKAGKYVRRTARYLPEADIAILDEGFRAAPSLLNALLRALNERSYMQDGDMVRMPLRSVVLTANDLPDAQDGLGAFHDRFLLRFEIKRLSSHENVREALFTGIDVEAPEVPAGALDLLKEEARNVTITSDAHDAFIAIRDDLERVEVIVSDRRWSKAARALKAQAAIAGRTSVSSARMRMLEDMLWERPEQRQVVREAVRKHVAKWIRDLESAAQNARRINEAIEVAGRHKKRGERLTALDSVINELRALKDLTTKVAETGPDAKAEAASLLRTVDRMRAQIANAMANDGIKPPPPQAEEAVKEEMPF